MAQQPKSLLSSLHNVKLSEVIPAQQQVVVLEHNQTIGEALRVLAKHKILSAPIVINPGLEDVESLVPGESAPSLLGWLDVMDIITAFLAFLREHKKELPTAMLALMAELDKYGPQFISKMLITVVGGEDKGLVYQADTDVTVLQAIRSTFLGQVGGHKNVHRLAIFDAHGDITHIVSQMDVLRYLLTLIQQLPDLGNRPIRDFGWVGQQHLVTLSATTPTLLAFQQLAAAGVLGAPVVSTNGRLVANLSVSDVRCIQPNHLGVLGLPVAEFLALNHNTAYLGYSQRSSTAAEHPFFAGGPRSSSSNGSRGMGPPSPVGGAVGAARAAALRAGAEVEEEGDGADEGVPLICVEPTATLGEVVKLLVARHVHRVYVRDKAAQPCEVVGIITPTDILKVVEGLCQDEEAAAAGADAIAAAPAGASVSPQPGPRKRQCTDADHI